MNCKVSFKRRLKRKHKLCFTLCSYDYPSFALFTPLRVLCSRTFPTRCIPIVSYTNWFSPQATRNNNLRATLSDSCRRNNRKQSSRHLRDGEGVPRNSRWVSAPDPDIKIPGPCGGHVHWFPSLSQHSHRNDPPPQINRARTACWGRVSSEQINIPYVQSLMQAT